MTLYCIHRNNTISILAMLVSHNQHMPGTSMWRQVPAWSCHHFLWSNTMCSCSWWTVFPHGQNSYPILTYREISPPSAQGSLFNSLTTWECAQHTAMHHVWVPCLLSKQTSHRREDITVPIFLVIYHKIGQYFTYEKAHHCKYVRKCESTIR